jgi:hypothetical protein
MALSGKSFNPVLLIPSSPGALFCFRFLIISPMSPQLIKWIRGGGGGMSNEGCDRFVHSGCEFWELRMCVLCE